MKNKKINPFTIFSLIGVLAIVFILYSSYNNKVDFDGAYAKNNKTIASLEKEFKIEKRKEKQIVDEMNPDLYSATNEGVRVSNFQNEIGMITDYTQDKDEKRFALNKDVKPLFKDGVGATSIWFYPAAGLNQGSFDEKSRLKYKWTFNSTFSTIRNDYPVLWTCRVNDSGIDLDGQLLAFALAKYDGKEKVFYNPKIYYTNLGSKYMGSNFNQDDNLRRERRDLNYEEPKYIDNEESENESNNGEKLREYEKDNEPLRDESYEELWGQSGGEN